MLYYTLGQWRIFFFMALAGVVCGCWYGIMERIARCLHAGWWLHALIDLFSALGIWMIVTLALVRSAYGEIRLYALVGAALGFALERITLGYGSRALEKRLCLFTSRLFPKISLPNWAKKFFR